MCRKIVLIVAAILAAIVVVGQRGEAVDQQGDSQQVSPIGAWDVKGNDEENKDWIATLVLRRDQNETAGYFDWIGSNGSCGREHVTANYDADSHVLRMTGRRVDFSDNVIRASYKAELSADGSAIVRGRFVGLDPADDGTPGTWTAERIKLR